MPVAGEVVPLNPDGTVPEGALYNPAAGVATVIPGGILDTGVPSTPPPEPNTTSGTAPAGSFQFYQEANEAGVYDKPEPDQVTLEELQAIYRARLGREGDPENVMNWVNAVNTGQMTLEEADAGIAGSEEGLAYAASQAAGADADPDTIIDTGTPEPDPEPVDPGPITPTTDFNPLIQQYYQELFNRQAQQPGLDYFTGRLRSGALTEDALRDAIISGATGTDRLYYDASQSGGPVFDATQALFGRRPARGAYNPATGQLEGGFGQYRSSLDAGQLTPEQLRRNLVQLAYRRGEGGGQSGDYQYYLNTLGIDRSDNPFLQDDGTYRNIPYGLNLAEYQQDPGMPPPPPGGNLPFPPGGDFPFPPGGGGMPPMSPGKGGLYQRPDGSYGGGGGIVGKGGGGMPGRMPGQYITGNQLYSGLPFGMTQPMGMMNFMQPIMQPTIYQPPQLSQQYMPNRGLMSGYSTGFGPYGGYRRPRFGGGKGGPRIMRPMGGKGGFGF